MAQLFMELSAEFGDSCIIQIPNELVEALKVQLFDKVLQWEIIFHLYSLELLGLGLFKNGKDIH